jgi:hypothetical protein
MTSKPISVLKPEDEKIFVVYHGGTGEIAHVHRVLTFPGAARKTHEAMEARALELAGRFGHARETMRVLQTDSFEARVPQKVNVETRKLVRVASR